MINHDTIIKLAREAGFCWPNIQTMTIEQRLERFAALVAAAEREACAKVCEQRAGIVSMFASMREARTHNDAVKGDAAAIRARSTS